MANKIYVFKIPRVGRPKWVRAKAESSGEVKIGDDTFIADKLDQFPYRRGFGVVWVEGHPKTSPVHSVDKETLSVINPHSLDETLNGGFIREFLQRKLQGGIAKVLPWVMIGAIVILLLIEFYIAKQNGEIIKILKSVPVPIPTPTNGAIGSV